MGIDYDHGDLIFDASFRFPVPHHYFSGDRHDNSLRCQDVNSQRSHQALTTYTRVERGGACVRKNWASDLSLVPCTHQIRRTNAAAEIRTFVRTLGRAIYAGCYLKLREHFKHFGLMETEEALEFARQYFTPASIRKFSEYPSLIKLDVEELSRCAKGAILCARKRCFLAESCSPLNSQFESIWDSRRQAGIGRRVAVAFIQHFGLNVNLLCKKANRIASHAFLDANPPPEPTAERGLKYEQVGCVEVKDELNAFGMPEALSTDPCEVLPSPHWPYAEGCRSSEESTALACLSPSTDDLPWFGTDESATYGHL